MRRIKKSGNTAYEVQLHAALRIELVHSGEDYFNRMLKIINRASKEIHLQTYIFENDKTGNEITEALIGAALRRVKVFVLLDGFGSSSFSKAIFNHLREQGVNIRFFAPLLSGKNYSLGRRLHHKVMVADGTVALIGGINIAGKYRGDREKLPWLDFAVQIDNDQLATDLAGICRNIYYRKKRNKIKVGYRKNLETSVNVLQNDWVKGKHEIVRSYLSAIQDSRNEVMIAGSYFLPGKKIINALCRAAARGVKVKLILAGLSDVPLMKLATSYLYTALLSSRIEVYEWHHSVLHAKVAVADGRWTTLGSFNLNHLSSYASIEMNVEVHSEDLAGELSAHLKSITAQCRQVTINSFESADSRWAYLKRWLAYRFIRFTIVLLTYSPFKKGKK